MPDTAPVRISRLITVPAIITLAVTLVRLAGELLRLPEVLFGRKAGGGFAIVGIVWLAWVFGIYFALKLARAGDRPARPLVPIATAVAGMILLIFGSYVAFAPTLHLPGKMIIGLLIMVIAAIIQLRPWPSLGKALMAYAYAARIPVVIVMYFAMRGHWGTHYDAIPPGMEQPSLWANFLYLAVLPQLLFWVAFTVVTGCLFGTVVDAIVNRSKQAPAGQAAAA